MIEDFVLQLLIEAIGKDRVSTDRTRIEICSTDALTPYRAGKNIRFLESLADVVVSPATVQDVQKVVKLASTYKIPVIPLGGGSGVMGAAVPILGGIVIDMKGFNKILSIDTEDMTAKVESGMLLSDLSNFLEEQGLMLGHDPWSLHIATVGGAICTNGIGYKASFCGSMGAQVLGLEAVLPNGEIITTLAVPQYSSAPNLNHLFIGSEGVFGIITKATIQIYRIPEKRSFSTFEFCEFQSGFDAVTELFGLGLKPALVDLAEEYGKVTLYLMFEGYMESVDAQRKRAVSVCSRYGGGDIGTTGSSEYWLHRHYFGENYLKEKSNRLRSVKWEDSKSNVDYIHVAIPASKVVEYKRRCDLLFRQLGVTVSEYSIWTRPQLFSMTICVRNKNLGSVDIKRKLSIAGDKALMLAQSMGGTMEYCHGVGIKLSHMLSNDMGSGFDLAMTIKKAIDPLGIMNSGKLFDTYTSSISKQDN